MDGFVRLAVKIHSPEESPMTHSRLLLPVGSIAEPTSVNCVGVVVAVSVVDGASDVVVGCSVVVVVVELVVLVVDVVDVVEVVEVVELVVGGAGNERWTTFPGDT